MNVMLLAAGFGTRLQPITNTIPKALVSVKGKPMLLYWLEKICAIEPKKVVINLHHFPEQIQNFVAQHTFPFPIYFSHESSILGTGGGLFQAKKFLSAEPFYLINIDILTDYVLEKTPPSFSSKTLASLLVQNRPELSRIAVDNEKNILGFTQTTLKDKPAPTQNQKKTNSYAFCGIHLIAPEIFCFIEQLPRVPFSIIDIYKQALLQGYLLKAEIFDSEKWLDIGTTSALAKAQTLSWV